jgi:hypothetical protein
MPLRYGQIDAVISGSLDKLDESIDSEGFTVSWLSRIIGAWVPKEERDGLSLMGSPAWEVSAPVDHQGFMRALSQLLPDDSILYLEGICMSKDICEFLSARQTAQAQKVAIGTIWPRPHGFHIPATPQNIEFLAAQFANHASPEICDHIHAYGPTGMVVWWADSFGSYPLYVAKTVSEDALKSFCNLLGSTYTDAIW